MKFALSFFSILLLMISGILFFQYQVYSSNLEEGNGEFTYSQEIEIVYRENNLDIRQHFKNLPNQKVQLQWPKNAVSPTCFIETEHSCDRLAEDLTNFSMGDVRSQSISYIIPLNGGLKSKELIEDVFANLENGTVRFTNVHISTNNDIDGQWVTNLPLIGQQSLSLVNYSMFSGNGQVKDLYWQDGGDLKLQFNDSIVSIYSNNPVSADLSETIRNMKFLNEEHISIVQGNNKNSDEANGILFLPDLTLDAIEQKIILSQVMTQFNAAESPSWLMELIASYLLKTDIGSNKAKEVKAHLSEYLTSKDELKWLTELEKLKGQVISPRILDEKLTTILGKKTSYFQMNTDYGEGVYPLLFEDPRSIYINDLPIETAKVILKDGQIYYLAEPILTALGYKASEGKNGYYVNSELRTFRFPKEPGFYVFNQRRYDTISEPIIKIAGDYYVQEPWLQRLFLVELNKGEKRITIKSTILLK